MKVLVTGANRGIGLEFCRQLLSPSFAVKELVACVRYPVRSTELMALAEQSHRRLQTVALDLAVDTDPDCSAAGLAVRIAEVASDHPFEVLINNAGVYLDEGKGCASFRFDAFRQSFEVNTLGPFKVLKEIGRMLAPGARIINVTSLMGSIGDNSSGGSYAYRSSKAALNMMNRCFAHERKDLISVVVHPGWVQTDMGGAEAPIKPEASVAGMLQLLRQLKPADSGQFFNYDGAKLPW